MGHPISLSTVRLSLLPVCVTSYALSHMAISISLGQDRVALVLVAFAHLDLVFGTLFLLPSDNHH